MASFVSVQATDEFAPIKDICYGLEPPVVKYLVKDTYEPTVLEGCITDWQILKWSLSDWQAKIGNEKLTFRKNRFLKSKQPLWEQTCDIVEMTIQEFIETQSQPNKEHWYYFDYKYMKDWFKKHPDLLEDVSWSKFGYPEMSGNDSTIWIGTEGAHTPCHKDSYGCNLIAQVYGRKKWILFPPEEDLRPTRVPYEESSVYSQLNFFSPTLNDFKALGIDNARTVTLKPGETLFLPRGWWHYVENTETAISINIWIPQPEDHRARVEEAFTQMFVAQITKELPDSDKTKILNPNCRDITDLPPPHCVNTLEYLCEEFKKRNKSKRFKSASLVDAETGFVEEILPIAVADLNMRAVPKLSLERFHQLIREQETKYFSDEEPYFDEENVVSVTNIAKIINSVCHPHVLSVIVDKLLKD